MLGRLVFDHYSVDIDELLQALLRYLATCLVDLWLKRAPFHFLIVLYSHLSLAFFPIDLVLVKKSKFNSQCRSGAAQVVHRFILVALLAPRVDGRLECARRLFQGPLIFCGLLYFPLPLLLHEHALIMEPVTSVDRGCSVLDGHKLALPLLDFSFLLLHQSCHLPLHCHVMQPLVDRLFVIVAGGDEA